MHSIIIVTTLVTTKSQKVKKEEKSQIKDPQVRIIELEKSMRKAAKNLDFQKAIAMRAEWLELKKQLGE